MPTPALPGDAPALPSGDDMPARSEPITSAELSAAIADLGRELRTQLSNNWSELAAATSPGRNVRDLPSDELSCFTGKAVVGTTQLLVPADESRTKVTLIATAADVWISSRPGVSRGDYNSAQLPANVPVELDTRAAIYCTTATAAGVDVTVLVQSAHYSL